MLVLVSTSLSALQRNGTTWSDGDIEMRTGEGDIATLGQIVSWNNQTTTDAYDGECSRLRGSSEGLFPPGLADITDSIAIFSTDLCRPLHFAKSGSNLLHGIPVTTFELDPDNFANSSVCSSNACYNNNIPSGVQVELVSLPPRLQCYTRGPRFTESHTYAIKTLR